MMSATPYPAPDRRTARLGVHASLLLGLLVACRSSSIEYVGETAKSLEAYQKLLGDAATVCEIQQGKQQCEHIEITGQLSNLYNDDKLMAESVAMLVEYGELLVKLSGKKSVGSDKFAEAMLTANEAAGAVELGDTGPAAIKAATEALDTIISGVAQRRIMKKTLGSLAAPMKGLNGFYTTGIKGHLQLVCTLQHQLQKQIDLFESLSCKDCSTDAACTTKCTLARFQFRDLQTRLRARRDELHRAAGGLAGFFGAHAALGRELAVHKSDRDVVASAKQDAEKARKDIEDDLREFEKNKCPTPASPTANPKQTEQP